MRSIVSQCVPFLLLVCYLLLGIVCCAPLCAFCLAVGCHVFVIVRVFFWWLILF